MREEEKCRFHDTVLFVSSRTEKTVKTVVAVCARVVAGRVSNVYIRSVSRLQDKLVWNFKLVTHMFSKFVYVADRFGRIVCGWQLINLGSRLWQINDVHLCVRRGYCGLPQCKSITVSTLQVVN